MGKAETRDRAAQAPPIADRPDLSRFFPSRKVEEGRSKSDKLDTEPARVCLEKCVDISRETDSAVESRRRLKLT